ncbi:hypothetical protein [Deferribacter desulfuricans]|uniref:hypothetical protein n=1 Tax=Deferribacter desulfuricans TaxID=197162 RepID=UPI0002D43C9F|nr:hypothetical protein [Deferribacter desulfuricans]
MKEKYLELKKIVVEMSDCYEFLTISEREELKKYKTELQNLETELSPADMDWVDNEFQKWYEKYIMMETLVFIKPKAG